MPGLDATGPNGQGAMTGWGEGRCQGDVAQPPPVYPRRGRQGYAVRGGFQSRSGRGRRRGFGNRGRGSRWGGPHAPRRLSFAVPPADLEVTELEALKREAEAHAENLERMKMRIAEMEASLKASLKASSKASPKASSTPTEST
jgi:hypothetical protein